MSTRLNIAAIGIFLCTIAFIIPVSLHADEGNGFTPKDFTLDAIENAAKSAVIGDVPSDDLNILTKDIYAKFLAKEFATDKSLSTCKRVANAQGEIGLENLNQKWWQGGWFNLGYKAIKYSIVIASGAAAAGLNDVLAEEARGVVSSTIDAKIRAEDDELVEIKPWGKCNTTVRAVWSKKDMRLYIRIEGNCNCADIKPRWTELSHDTLKEFRVDISADVVVEGFEVEEKNPLIFWREKRVKVFLGTKNMEVDTKANCMCATDAPPPPWVDEDGVVTEEETDPVGTGTGDGSETGTDDTDEVGEDGTTTEDDDAGTSGVVGLIKKLFGGDGATDEPQDQPTDPVTEPADNGVQPPADKPLMCGDTVSIEGRTNVATFPYRPDPNGDVNFSCNNSCAADEICKVLPESVRAFHDSCVYCAKKPKEEVADTSPPPEPVTTGGSCEQALRLMLDEYGGWFDPPLTVSANGATMFHEHRCFDEEHFDQFTRQAFSEGVVDAKYKAMCPTLTHDRSFMTRITAGAKGLCSSTSEFSF